MKMFRDIFTGRNSKLSCCTDLELHYISRSYSLEVDTADDLTDTEDEDQRRLHQDPFTGRLSVVDAALASLPCQLIDKHWHWVTTLDLSRNQIE